MTIGILQVELQFPDAQSLKDKRQVLMSLKTRLRQTFNVSVAETGQNDLWQSGELSVAVIANERQHANEVLSKAANFIERFDGAIMGEYRTEFL